MTQVPVLDQAAVLSKLDRTRVLGALEKAFGGLGNGRSIQPAQTVIVLPDNRGDCIFYPGALLDLGLIGVKVSPYLQDRAEAGKYPVTAYTLLLSASTGQPLLLCDSYALTSIRTAATTGLAVKYLAAESARVIALIGTGEVGREHLRYALPMGDWTEVRVYSPSAAAPGGRQDEVRQSAARRDITFCSSSEDAARGADVVMLCTSSGTPVIDPSWVSAGALVTSIGTNSPGAHEIEPGSLPSFDVFCDYRATAPTTAGEMKIAIEAGSWSATSIVADLPELVGGFTPAATGRPRFFRSTGLGIEDLAIAHLLVEYLG
jgi:L-arginine dehydrogenase